MLHADVEADRGEFTVRAAVSVAPGERLALFGPSGAGKTTFLEAIAGLVPLRRGRIVLNDRVLTSTSPSLPPVPSWRRRVGLLRQDPGLFPHLSVRGNLGYAPTAGRDARLTEIAAALGLGGVLEAMPARLSGGQAHRVALGRVLLADCDALLLDEPYSGLDPGLRRSLTELVIRLASDRRVPAILVAHELSEAQSFASRLAVLDRGRLLQAGPPDEVVLRPATRRVAELTGYLAFVPIRRGADGGIEATGAGAGQKPGQARERGHGRDHMVAAVHPDRVVAGAHPDRGLVLAGPVTAGRPSGVAWETEIAAGGAVIVCRLAGRPASGDGSLTVTALAPPCFGPDGSALPGSADDSGGVLPYSAESAGGSSPTINPPPCPQVR